MSIFASTAQPIDERRLAVCPACKAGPIWRNTDEFARHVDACLRIAANVAETRALEKSVSAITPLIESTKSVLRSIGKALSS